MWEQQTPSWVVQYLYIFDSQKNFVGIKTNILSKWEFSIENKPKISPIFLRL